MTFDQDASYWKSKEEHSDIEDEDKKHVAPKEYVTSTPSSSSHPKGIFFAVNNLIQFQKEPRHDNWIPTKHILRYLCGTVNYCLRYALNGQIQLQGYTDSNWVGNADDRKITFGVCFNLDYAMVSWMSRKQTSSALSTGEEKYIASYLACCEGVWIEKLLFGLFNQLLEPIVLLCDNQSYVKLVDNPLFHDKTKHIEIKYHYICDIVQKGVVRFSYILVDENTYAILTKPLSQVKFVYFRDNLGLVEKSSISEREN
eukprot:PITA_23453